jgi:hypothetical protein
MAQAPCISVARLVSLALAVLISTSLSATEGQGMNGIRKSAPSPVRCVNCIVRPAKLICAPKAAYPELARVAHIAGEVRFSATIAIDGRVKSLQLLSGHYLLVGAAMDAAKRYRYKPAIARLDGLVPMEEALLITVQVRPDTPAVSDSAGCDSSSSR